MLPVDFERMRADAASRGWSLQEWAERAGLNRRTLYRILNGHTANPATAAALAKTLGRALSSYVNPSTP